MLLQQIGCVEIWQIGVDDVIVKILEENSMGKNFERNNSHCCSNNNLPTF